MLLGTYEAETVQILRRLVKPGMVVVDSGAHVGYVTRIFSEAVGSKGKVLAFEIDPKNLLLLHENTRGLTNVEIIPAALGNRDGEATLFSADLSSGHSASASKPGVKAAGSIPMRTIGAVLRERGVERADIIKLDIEGGEPAVLRSIPDGPVSIVFEVKRYILGPAGESPEALLSELIDRGFRVRPVGGDELSKADLVDELPELDKANIEAVR